MIKALSMFTDMIVTGLQNDPGPNRLGAKCTLLSLVMAEDWPAVAAIGRALNSATMPERGHEQVLQDWEEIRDSMPQFLVQDPKDVAH